HSKTLPICNLNES
ncbi:beta-galactoside-binding lectin, partial [Trichinella spiralis]